MVGAEKARRLLGRVVDLVGDAARGQVERRALRIDGRAAPGAMRSSASSHVTTRKPRRPRGAASARAGGRAHAVAPRTSGERSEDVAQRRRVERRRGVQPQQLEPHHAEVRARDRPVGESRRAERTAVAHAVAQDAPRERQLDRGSPTRSAACRDSGAASAGRGRTRTHGKGYAILSCVYTLNRSSRTKAASVSRHAPRSRSPASREPRRRR